MIANTKTKFKLEFITTPSGQPRAVILNINDWEQISETLNIMSSKELTESIDRAKKQLKKGVRLLSFEETFADL
jgi:PHD/YefM family antitoxin component YafN of YafNO toxin-antitoxin module